VSLCCGTRTGVVEKEATGGDQVLEQKDIDECQNVRHWMSC
jgi:hypothetical protein